MDKNRLILNTNDRVVTTTSLGNQEKWFDRDKNLWYKVDAGRFEALAEAAASEILRNYTNANDIRNIFIAKYSIERGKVHGRDCVLSVSENFKAKDDSIVTVNTILRNAVGEDYVEQFNRRASLKERIKYLVSTVEKAAHIDGFGEYLTVLFEVDALILNQDRHLNNIALINTAQGYKPCPIFDNGMSFLLDASRYRFDIDTKAYMAQARALPFKATFTRCVHAAQELYGKQLKVGFSEAEAEQIADKYLAYYPPQIASYLKERIVTVLTTQQKKLFK